MNAEDMPITAPHMRMWTLSADRLRVRMRLPPLPLAELAIPLRVSLDFDAEAVDAILLQLTELRARMLPPPQCQ